MHSTFIPLIYLNAWSEAILNNLLMPIKVFLIIEEGVFIPTEPQLYVYYFSNYHDGVLPRHSG